jgi:hypothetical protein
MEVEEIIDDDSGEPHAEPDCHSAMPGRSENDEGQNHSDGLAKSGSAAQAEIF